MIVELISVAEVLTSQTHTKRLCRVRYVTQEFSSGQEYLGDKR